MAAPVPHLGTGDGAIRSELLPQPLVIYPIIQVLHIQVDPLHTGGKKAAWDPKVYSSLSHWMHIPPAAQLEGGTSHRAIPCRSRDTERGQDCA